MKRTCQIALVAALVVPSTAQADFFGRRGDAINDHPAYITLFALGTIGGLANSVGALVYAVQKRSFHTPWILTSILSSAMCGTIAGAVMYDAATQGSSAGHVASIAYHLVTAIWPLAWVTVSSLHPAHPGKKLDTIPEPTDSGAAWRQAPADHQAFTLVRVGF